MSAPLSTTSGASRTFNLRGGLSLTVNEYGADTDGSAVLLLHGGAGSRSMAGLATALSKHVYAIAPTHPGFDGTPRPESTDSVADLATAYLDLLDTLGLTGVTVVGNSLGGWIAAETAVRDTRNCIGALTLLNALGIAPDDEDDLVDVRTVAPSEIGKLSFTNPAFRPDFASDGIASVKYGRAYADSFPDGHFVAIPEAGHFPHLEQTGRTLGAIGEFVGTVVKPSIAD